MNKKEHDEFLEQFKAFAKELMSSKEKSLEFRVNAGINTPTGKLKKAYKPQSVSSK